MEHLTGINIRSGLEKLQLSVDEIFRIKTDEEGDKRVKELYLEGDKTFDKYPDLIKLIEETGHLEFSDKKEIHKISKNLTAFVTKKYDVILSPIFLNGTHCCSFTEIKFVNNTMLSFDDYCHNLMKAQAFSGAYDAPPYMHQFIGIGDFKMEDYAGIHDLVSYSNCNMFYFFIYYKNILISIYDFISTRYKDDIISQKKYLSEEEFQSLLRACMEERKELIKNMNKNLSSLFDDFDINRDNDDEEFE